MRINKFNLVTVAALFIGGVCMLNAKDKITAQRANPDGHNRGISVEEYRRGEAQIRELVKKGKVSKEDAEKRLIEMRKAIRGEKKPESDSRHSVDGLKKKYDSLEKEIWSAVKAGKLSKKDAGKKLAALKKKMFGGKEGHDKEDDLKRKYNSLEKEMQAAIKAGKLSKKDAGKKLAALKKEMFGGNEGHDKKDWDEKKDPDIEKLKRQLEALKRENERLRKRLEGRRRR